MDIIFAMDIRGGIVVKGYKGDRERYEPIERHSKICGTSDPLNVIDTIKPKRAYIADLDRILGWGSNSLIIQRLSARTKTLIDAGIRRLDDVREAERIGNTAIIGTETANLDVIRAAQSMRIAVSIDMRDRRVVSPDPVLSGDPLGVIERMNLYKMSELLVLDIDRVGTKHGINAEFLERVLEVSGHPVVVAGGIKSSDDLDVLEDLGAAGVILSTALHEELVPVDLVR
ncbi:MAG TPA: HisA/HisF-related TIM barrel protein [Candidatus Bathyarchaeia archaeon]|nr:HisA/HisF-related TIM barrel protein [Candidatus Bathyarchaeia archaeon]